MIEVLDSEPSIKIFTKIFQNLNFTDLKNCRLVSVSWNELITESEEFLASGIFHASLESNNREVLFKTKVQWQYLRFSSFHVGHQAVIFIDFSQSSAPKFFQHFKTLELHGSILHAETIKLFLTHCPQIEWLIITNCKYLDSRHSETAVNQDRKFFLNNDTNVAALRGITISNIGNCIPLIKFLAFFVRLDVKTLQLLKIYYHPQEEYVDRNYASTLLIMLERLITQNILTLEVLILNIRCTEILNDFGLYVLRELQFNYGQLKLKVFKLAEPIWSPGIGDGQDGNVSITSESQIDFFVMLAEFLAKQRSLKSIAFPHFTNLGKLEGRRYHILDQVPKNIEKIRVPGPNYIRRSCLKLFKNLKVFFIGENVVGGPGQILNPCKLLYDFRRGVGKRNISKIHTLEIYSQVNYEPGVLYHILEKFPLLTTFKLNCFRALLNDRDVQAIINYLENLRELSIVHCDLITDAGISGLPLHLCQELMDSLGTNYYTLGDLEVLFSGNQAKDSLEKPLSHLKCLRSLKLIGKSGVTDAGICFGIRFNNLRELQLPRNERITEWGIQTIGQFNPCLESLTLTGINPAVASGFTQLLHTHQRIQKEKSSIIESETRNGNETATAEEINSSLLSAILFITREELKVTTTL